MTLHGKTALVTGGAHRLGRGIAIALAEAGADVVIHYGRSADEAAATAADLRALGVKAVTVQADLAKPADIAAMFKQVGRLDVLINSAASVEKQAFEEITAQAWDQVMAVNLRAPFLCTQSAAPLMRSGGGGVVINIADLSGVHAWVDFAHHAVSKAGLIHLTKIAARELAPHIRVNAVIPGAILPPPGMELNSAEWQQVAARVPVQRTGEADRIGKAVVFLAENDFVSGEVVTVDGGEHLLGPIGH